MKSISIFCIGTAVIEPMSIIDIKCIKYRKDITALVFFSREKRKLFEEIGCMTGILHNKVNYRRCSMAINL